LSFLYDMNYPFCANHPPLISLHHQDIDEQAARLTGYDQEYQQVSSGHFNGSFLTCEIDNDLSLYFESTNQVLLQTGVVPAGYFALGLLLESPGPMIFNSQEFTEGSAFLLSPNSEFSGTTIAGTKIWIINISTNLLQQCCDQQFLQRFDADSGKLPGTILKSEGRTGILLDMLYDFLEGRERSSIYLNDESQRMAFKKAFATVTEWIFSESDNDKSIRAESGSGGKRKVFQQARDLINANIKDDIPVQFICRHLGISRRCLEYSFQEHVQMSPAKYIKLLRLNNIRREILSSENCVASIGDLAARWGIWHLGRFAKDYQILFGELPSSTRKQFDFDYLQNQSEVNKLGKNADG
jgi:AraC family transcriptional regulator, ethanolamine operon transcriptional activator